MNEENSISYYAIIPATVRYDKNLKPSEKLIYGEITSLTNKYGYCYATNKYFAKLYNVTIHTVSQWISHLEKLGYIHIELIRNTKKEIKERRIYIRDAPYVQKSTYPYVLKSTYPMYKNVQKNNKDYKIDRLFKYIINRESKFVEELKEYNFVEIYEILEDFEFLYTEDLISTFTEDNILKVKTIIYILAELSKCNTRIMLKKITREKLIRLYDKCMMNKNEIINFQEYYLACVINELDKPF